MTLDSVHLVIILTIHHVTSLHKFKNDLGKNIFFINLFQYRLEWINLSLISMLGIWVSYKFYAYTTGPAINELAFNEKRFFWNHLTKILSRSVDLSGKTRLALLTPHETVENHLFTLLFESVTFRIIVSPSFRLMIKKHSQLITNRWIATWQFVLILAITFAKPVMGYRSELKINTGGVTLTPAFQSGIQAL